MMDAASSNNHYYEPPSTSLGFNPQDPFHLSLHNNLPIHHEQLLQKQDATQLPLLQEQSTIPPPPYSFAVSAASEKNVPANTGVAKTTIGGPTCDPTCDNLPPIIHPAPKSPMPNNRPTRKRRIVGKPPDYRAFQQFSKRQQQRAKGASTATPSSSSSSSRSKRVQDSQHAPDKAPPPIDPVKARLARRKRRRLRARSQAINLVGGGDITEIERRAVADSDLNDRTTRSSGGLLLPADFSTNFHAEMFADATFERVCDAMAEAGNANDEAAEARPVPFASDARGIVTPGRGNGPRPMRVTSDSGIVSDRAVESIRNDANTGYRNPKPIPTAAASKAKAPSDTAVVTPPTRDKATLKTLPSGKDPESRKLRRLMRNRLSAQASRDRRKKAIEDAQRSTAMKEAEIQHLEKTLGEETRRMLLLERAVGFARDYLGRERYAKVAKGKVSCSRASGGGSQGKSGRVAATAANRGANAIQSN